MLQLCNRVWVENTAVTGTWVLSAVTAMDMSYCSTCWASSLTCHTPTMALAMRIRRMTKGSTKAVTVSSPSSNQASTWDQSGKDQISDSGPEKHRAHMSEPLHLMYFKRTMNFVEVFYLSEWKDSFITLHIMCEVWIIRDILVLYAFSVISNTASNNMQTIWKE